MPSRHKFRPAFEFLEDRAVPAIYYVSPTGSDGASGAGDQPWRTLQHAAERVAVGDTVVVRAGDYAGFHLETDGTAAAPITFRGEPGARITTRNPVTPDGINLEGADYVVIEGFTVINQPRAGIRSVLNEHVTIRANLTDNNQVWGIFTGFSYDLLIENNTATRSHEQHGIYVSNSGDRPVIRGNTIWGNSDCGIHMNGDVSQGGDGIISNAVVENNVIYNNGTGGGSSINCDGVQNSIIRNNLIYDAHSSGISLYKIDAADGSRNNLIVNNTVLVASDGRWALNILPDSSGNTVRNNILFSAQSFRGAISIAADSLVGFTSDYNITEDRFTLDDGDSVLTLGAWQALGRDLHSLATADPLSLFSAPVNGVYRLKAGSAAIDRGTAVNAPTDFEGHIRPTGAGFDIGHDEYSTSPPPPPTSPPPPSFPPNSPPPPPGSVGNVRKTREFAAGSGDQGTVRLFGPTGSPLANLTPFPGFAGSIRTAAADVTGDGIADLVVATGPGMAAQIKVFDGSNLSEVFSSAVYEGFTGGVFVATGDLTGDGVADLILTPDQGGGPRVLLFRGGDFQMLASVFGIDDPNFRGGARAASGDLNGDGRDDLIVAVGFGGGPRVAAYDGRSVLGGPLVPLFGDMFVFDPSLRNGVYVAAGDVNGDGYADLIAGAGPGGGPQVLTLSGWDLINGMSNNAQRLTNFFAGNPDNRGGVRVAVKDLDGDTRADLVVGDGAGGGSRVTAYAGKDFAGSEAPELLRMDVFPASISGVFVG